MGLISLSDHDHVLRRARSTIDELDRLAHGMTLLGRAAARVGQNELTRLASDVQAELASRAEQLRALMPLEELWTGP